jgi:hypothetical protein
MVSNIYIDSVMDYIKGFRGTYSSNNIPFLKDRQSAIINFSKYGEEGSHFIAMIGMKKKNVYILTR